MSEGDGMTEDRPPAALLESVARDLRPVRPLLPPWGRGLLLLPLGLPLVAGAPLFWGWRSNFTERGPAAAGALSPGQVPAGLPIGRAGRRAGAPGRRRAA